MTFGLSWLALLAHSLVCVSRRWHCVTFDYIQIAMTINFWHYGLLETHLLLLIRFRFLNCILYLDTVISDLNFLTFYHDCHGHPLTVKLIVVTLAAFTLIWSSLWLLYNFMCQRSNHKRQWNWPVTNHNQVYGFCMYMSDTSKLYKSKDNHSYIIHLEGDAHYS